MATSPDYVSNCPISQAIPQTVEPDVDLNGLKFSYEIGIFYTPSGVLQPLKLPPSFECGPR